MTAGGETVVAALPASLRSTLLPAVRQAADRLGKPALPTVLRPYAGFTPAALGEGAALQALSRALATDGRLRESVGQALGRALWDHAEKASIEELVAAHGEGAAAAALIARARWDDVVALAASLPAHVQAPPRSPDRADPAAKVDAAAARRERVQAQRKAALAEQRAAQTEEEIRSLRQRLAAAEAERDRLAAELVAERSRSRDRLARLQRRATEAEARARTDGLRLAQIATELEDLAGRLRSGDPAPQPPLAAPAVRGEERAASAAGAAIPRTVRPARPGRPCVLPPGVTDDQPDAVLALLAVPRIAVVVDGYNVTKDLRGQPTAALTDQRAWLGQLLAGVAAPRDLRVTVVFDGDGERTQAAAARRSLRVVYTAEGETADARIVAIVADLPPDAPVLVITSDGEVRDACTALGANVVASTVFLKTVG
jgi:predicted RNA-binding protein with PIN domain